MEMNSGSGSDNSDHSFSKEAFEEHKDSCKWDFIIKTLPKSLAELRPKMELLESTSLFNQIKHYHRDVYCARFCLNLIKQIEVIHLNPGSHSMLQSDSCYYVCKGAVKVTIQTVNFDDSPHENSPKKLISNFVKFNTQQTYMAQNSLNPEGRKTTFKINKNSNFAFRPGSPSHNDKLHLQPTQNIEDSIGQIFRSNKMKSRHSTIGAFSSKMVNFGAGTMITEDHLISQKSLILHGQNLQQAPRSILLTSETYTILFGISTQAIRLARSTTYLTQAI